MDKEDPATLEAGIAALDWGSALEVDDSGVYLLPRECDGETHPDYGGTHHTTQWVEALGRSVHLIRESAFAEQYAADSRLPRQLRRVVRGPDDVVGGTLPNCTSPLLELT